MNVAAHATRARRAQQTTTQRLPRGVTQPTLLSAEAKADIAFLDYHSANPHIFAAFAAAALQLRARGITHYGAKAIFEHIRFETAIRAGTDVLKINNNYTSRYARLLMATDTRFLHFFELRTLKTER